MKVFNYVVSLFSVLVFCLSAQVQTTLAADPVLAGRGQDVFMIVNPNDENSLRIAEAYQQLRNIPDNNILMLVPPETQGFIRLSLPADQFWQDYVETVHGEIQNRGLSDQIDFIVVVGQPHSFNDQNFNFQSLSYGLMQLDQYFAGMSVSAGQAQSSGIASLPSDRALHHSVPYPNVNGSTTGTHHYYVCGFLGITSQFGNSADQVIAGLQRSVAADGMKPQGQIYFEENDNIRSDTREFQWPSAQAELSARNIPFVIESDIPGATPLDRIDVRGAVIGSSDAIVPNGSRYLPGSWVDNLTSFGSVFTSAAQTKATNFIATGAAATSGTVAEPTANWRRFPSADIFASIDSGLTLGEAYLQSVVDPDMLQFIGDILAQPYADIAEITLTTHPELAVVSDTIDISVDAEIPTGGPTTSVVRLELYTDGKLFDTLSGDSGLFSFDTTQLSDGVHEFRVVAIANNIAESEGISIRRLQIDNQGHSVSVTQQFYNVNKSGTVQIPVAAAQGNATIARIELRHLGRQVTSASGSSTALSLAASQLAFGPNTITPVAIFDDGQEVRGTSFVVNRHPEFLPGGSIPGVQRAGIKAEYFLGGGAETIDTSDFSGVPDIVTQHVAIDLANNANLQTFATDETDDVAIRFSGSFSVTADNVGEYVWSAVNSSDSLRLLVDGDEILSYDNQAFGIDRGDGSTSVFLAEGRHDFEILYANTAAGDGPKLNLVLRGPDGVTRNLSDEFVYSIETPSFPLGDCNQDGNVNFLDIAPFIAVLSNGGFRYEADIDGNGLVNFLDISSFIALLNDQ